MQFHLVRAARLGVLGLIVSIGAITLAGKRISEPTDSGSKSSSEVVRLRAHFDSVDSELRAREVSRLTPSQLAQRTRLIAWLHEYRNAGIFPINDRFPDRMVPFFRDSKGTLCAMAYLIDRSGRGDIVNEVARTRNNAFIPDLATDAELAAWLESSGRNPKEQALKARVKN